MRPEDYWRMLTPPLLLEELDPESGAHLRNRWAIGFKLERPGNDIERWGITWLFIDGDDATVRIGNPENHGYYRFVPAGDTPRIWSIIK